MELVLLKLIWTPCHVMCTAVLIGWDPLPPPPAFGLVYEGAIGQPRKITSPCNPPCQDAKADRLVNQISLYRSIWWRALLVVEDTLLNESFLVVGDRGCRAWTNKIYRHQSKMLTCKGTLRQVFIRVYRLEIQPVMLVFSTKLCELSPLYPSLWFSSTPLTLPCVNKYTV